jgi:hypothetical protein
VPHDSCVPGRPVVPLALAAWLVAANGLVACGGSEGPSASPAGPSGGDSGGTPAGGEPGGDSGGAATRWSMLTGGAGDEWVQDVAAAGGGSVVALTVIGPRAGGFDQIGLLQVDGGGRELWGRTYDVGAPVRFAPDGALSIGPGGEVYLALAATCGTGCGGLGTRFSGSALVQFSASGDVRWLVPLPGNVVSQPVVDPPGNVAVACAAAAANVVRSYAASGALRWEIRLPGAADDDVALAADAGGNVIVARGTEVAKVRPNGALAWSRSIGAAVAGVAGTSSEVVVVAASTAAGPVVLLLQPNGDDGPVHPIAGGRDGILVEVGTGRRVGAVTGAGGCGATVTALDVDGSTLWSRPVPTADCGGSELSVNAVTVTTTGTVVVGGALRGPVDLGRGRHDPKGTDGFLAAF